MMINDPKKKKRPISRKRNKKRKDSMEPAESKKHHRRYFCILCRENIQKNISHPYCEKCETSCNSFEKATSSVMPAYYCHFCGEPDYITEENPICDDCIRNQGNY